MIASPNHSSRGGAHVRLVVLHTAEGARTAAELGAYFAKASTQASSHVGIDDHGIEQYVPYDRAAWTVRSGNQVSDNAELCGFAAWTREQWLDEHKPMLDRAAAWIRERCTARGIPIRKLTPAQVAAGEAGVIGHVDWTKGMHDGTHTDPGANFPWDYVITRAAGTTTIEEDELSTEAEEQIYSIYAGLYLSSHDAKGKYPPIAQTVAKTAAAVTGMQAAIGKLADAYATLAARQATGLTGEQLHTEVDQLAEQLRTAVADGMKAGVAVTIDAPGFRPPAEGDTAAAVPMQQAAEGGAPA